VDVHQPHKYAAHIWAISHTKNHPSEQKANVDSQIFDKRYDRTYEVNQANQICSRGVRDFRNEQVNQDITKANENNDCLKI